MEGLTELAQSAIQQIADGLGVATEFVWEILIRQAYVEGASRVLFALVVVAVAMIDYRLFRAFAERRATRAWREIGCDSRENQEMTHWVPQGVVAVLCFVCAIIVMCEATTALTCFINPKYWAMSEIFDVIRQATP